MKPTGGERSDLMNLRQNVVIPCVQCNQGGYRHGYSGRDIFFTNILLNYKIRTHIDCVVKKV